MWKLNDNLDEYYVFAKSFRMVKDIYDNYQTENLNLQLIADKKKDGREGGTRRGRRNQGRKVGDNEAPEICQEIHCVFLLYKFSRQLWAKRILANILKVLIRQRSVHYRKDKLMVMEVWFHSIHRCQESKSDGNGVGIRKPLTSE